MIDTREYTTDFQALTTIAIMLERFNTTLERFNDGDVWELLEEVEEVMISSGAAYVGLNGTLRANRG